MRFIVTIIILLSINIMITKSISGFKLKSIINDDERAVIPTMISGSY